MEFSLSSGSASPPSQHGDWDDQDVYAEWQAQQQERGQSQEGRGEGGEGEPQQGYLSAEPQLSDSNDELGIKMDLDFQRQDFKELMEMAQMQNMHESQLETVGELEAQLVEAEFSKSVASAKADWFAKSAEAEGLMETMSPIPDASLLEEADAQLEGLSSNGGGGGGRSGGAGFHGEHYDTQDEGGGGSSSSTLSDYSPTRRLLDHSNVAACETSMQYAANFQDPAEGEGQGHSEETEAFPAGTALGTSGPRARNYARSPDAGDRQALAVQHTAQQRQEEPHHYLNQPGGEDAFHNEDPQQHADENSEGETTGVYADPSALYARLGLTAPTEEDLEEFDEPSQRKQQQRQEASRVIQHQTQVHDGLGNDRGEGYRQEGESFDSVMDWIGSKPPSPLRHPHPGVEAGDEEARRHVENREEHPLFPLGTENINVAQKRRYDIPSASLANSASVYDLPPPPTPPDSRRQLEFDTSTQPRTKAEDESQHQHQQRKTTQSDGHTTTLTTRSSNSNQQQERSFSSDIYSDLLVPQSRVYQPPPAAVPASGSHHSSRGRHIDEEVRSEEEEYVYVPPSYEADHGVPRSRFSAHGKEPPAAGEVKPEIFSSVIEMVRLEAAKCKTRPLRDESQEDKLKKLLQSEEQRKEERHQRRAREDNSSKTGRFQMGEIRPSETFTSTMDLLIDQQRKRRQEQEVRSLEFLNHVGGQQKDREEEAATLVSNQFTDTTPGTQVSASLKLGDREHQQQVRDIFGQTPGAKPATRVDKPTSSSSTSDPNSPSLRVEAILERFAKRNDAFLKNSQETQRDGDPQTPITRMTAPLFPTTTATKEEAQAAVAASGRRRSPEGNSKFQQHLTAENGRLFFREDTTSDFAHGLSWQRHKLRVSRVPLGVSVIKTPSMPHQEAANNGDGWRLTPKPQGTTVALVGGQQVQLIQQHEIKRGSTAAAAAESDPATQPAVAAPPLPPSNLSQLLRHSKIVPLGSKNPQGSNMKDVLAKSRRLGMSSDATTTTAVATPKIPDAKALPVDPRRMLRRADGSFIGM